MESLPKEIKNIFETLSKYYINLNDDSNLVELLMTSELYNVDENNYDNLSNIISLASKSNESKLLEKELKDTKKELDEYKIYKYELDKSETNNLKVENAILKNKLEEKEKELIISNFKASLWNDYKRMLENYENEISDLKDKLEIFTATNKGTKLELEVYEGLTKVNEEQGDSYFNIENVSKTSNTGDIKLTSEEITILVDTKNYSKDSYVKKPELDKLKQDLVSQKAHIGVLVSTTKISAKRNLSVDIIRKDDNLYYILYVNNYDNNHAYLYDLIKNSIFNYKFLTSKVDETNYVKLTKELKLTKPIYDNVVNNIKTIGSIFDNLEEISSPNNQKLAKENKQRQIDGLKEITKEDVMEFERQHKNGRRSPIDYEDINFLFIYTEKNVTKYAAFNDKSFNEAKKRMEGKEMIIYKVK